MDPRFECRFVRTLIGVFSIQFLQQIELTSLFDAPHLIISNIFDQLFDITMPCIDVSPLENARQE